MGECEAGIYVLSMITGDEQQRGVNSTVEEYRVRVIDKWMMG